MRTTKTIYSKLLLSITLIGFSGLSFANNLSSPDKNISNPEGMQILLNEPGGLRYVNQRTTSGNDGDDSLGFEQFIMKEGHSRHLKEHGGQIYETTKFSNEWTVDKEGNGTLGLSFESLVGTDENRLFIESNVSKPESSEYMYDISALYSRNFADFWDVQAGVRYSEDKNNRNSNRVDGVIGILGLAPYFFETKAYLYGGENNFLGASFEFDRDFLLTQNLITQPYIGADLVFSDDSNYASKSGLAEFKTGIKTRYEINKRIRPFVDVAYQYEKGQKATYMQDSTASEKGWLYGAGIELVF